MLLDDSQAAAATTEDSVVGEGDGELTVIADDEEAEALPLDPKSMKIQELRDELSARNLSTKGITINRIIVICLAHI